MSIFGTAGKGFSPFSGSTKRHHLTKSPSDYLGLAESGNSPTIKHKNGS